MNPTKVSFGGSGGIQSVFYDIGRLVVAVVGLIYSLVAAVGFKFYFGGSGGGIQVLLWWQKWDPSLYCFDRSDL